MPTKKDITKELENTREELRALISAIDNIDNHYEYDGNFVESRIGYYGYISSNRGVLLTTLRQVHDIMCNESGYMCSPKFLDVGCGIGTTLLLAEQFFTPHGLEINEKLMTICKQYNKYHHYPERFYTCDALQFNKYHQFDVIYYYCPIADYNLQNKLELKIEKDMRIGAYLIPFHKKSIKIYDDSRYKKHFKRIKLKHGYVYKKIKEIKDKVE